MRPSASRGTTGNTGSINRNVERGDGLVQLAHSMRGGQDLKEPAGVVVKTKAVEQVSEAIGRQIEQTNHSERQAALSSNVEENW